jgi:hypothetical protein
MRTLHHSATLANFNRLVNIALWCIFTYFKELKTMFILYTLFVDLSSKKYT